MFRSLIFFFLLHGSFCATYIDTNTPEDRRSFIKDENTISFQHDDLSSNSTYQLVMSDEFETDGRSFDENAMDPMWTAIKKPDDTNQADEFYDPSHVTTVDGKLEIKTTNDKVSWKQWDSNKGDFTTVTKNYTSGMVMSWNKFCFTGGILEISAQLPGDGVSGTFWPAAWLMGNLAKATYGDSTMYVWPWSTNECTEASAKSQKFSACRDNEYDLEDGMNAFQGRGAPEIDLFEVMPGIEGMGKFDYQSYISTSLQVSPSIQHHHPVNLHPLNSSYVWYEPRHGNKTIPNQMFYSEKAGFGPDTPLEGYVADAVSGNTDVSNDLFNNQHIYRLEWEPGTDGYLNWYLDGEFLWGVDGSDLQEKAGAMIPEEPMYLIFNTALSDSWAMPEPCDMEACHACYRCYDCSNPDCWCAMPDGMKGCANFPGRYLIDYVRLYQNPSNPKHTVACDTKEYPTAAYIAKNPELFADWKPDTVGPYFGFTQVEAGISAGILVLGSIILASTWMILKNRQPRAAYTELGKDSKKTIMMTALSKQRKASDDSEAPIEGMQRAP
mmetsp:Transcript_24346/g.31787  ORF Transcript_24346/g.31787 Transcript_24346/m.31787 type:complete len:552 (+) Transcript_24346:194-1849(+)